MKTADQYVTKDEPTPPAKLKCLSVRCKYLALPGSNYCEVCRARIWAERKR